MISTDGGQDIMNQLHVISGETLQHRRSELYGPIAAPVLIFVVLFKVLASEREWNPL